MPTVISSSSVPAAGNLVRVVFSPLTDNVTPLVGVTGFTVKVNAVSATILGVIYDPTDTGGANVLMFMLQSPVYFGDVVTVTTLSSNLTGSTGGALSDYTNSPVTNNSEVRGPLISVEPTHPWFTFRRFLDRFGDVNVLRASNKQTASNTYNTQAIQDAFDDSVEDLENFYRGSKIAVPFTFARTTSGEVPRKVATWAMWISYGLLYFSRGVDDKDKIGNRLQKELDRVWREAAYYREIGQLEMDQSADSLGGESSEEIGVVTQRDVVRDQTGAAGRFADEVPINLR